MTTYQYTTNNIPDWQTVKKPAEIAESRLIKAILEGVFPINSQLPAERELAESIGVTRPTLREALQRLERDGWIEIHQGKPTRVRDYWEEGSLGILKALAAYPAHLPDKFIPDLLTVRLALAPSYTAMAVENAPDKISHLLEERFTLSDDPQTYACFDWQIHQELTRLSANTVFVMIINGFKDLYLHLAPQYFSNASARAHSMNYYHDLSQASIDPDPNQARTLTERVMRESMIFW